MGVNNFSYSLTGEQLTEGFEEERFLAYDDARPDYILQPGDKIIGTLTIGFGHTGKDVYIGMTTTHDENMTLLQQDTMRAQLAVNTYVHIVLTQEEFDALVDFVFNVGAGNFKDSTVLKLLNESKYTEAAKHLEDWQYSKGVKLAGLLRRRVAEEAEFNTPGAAAKQTS